jgi:hypothetical protein
LEYLKCSQPLRPANENYAEKLITSAVNISELPSHLTVECAAHAMRKQLKLSSDGDESGSRNANEAVVVPTVGSGGVCV